MGDRSEPATLLPPLLANVHEIDLEAGSPVHIMCRICLDTQGGDFIAPCKCKGTSKYVHRDCLDQWRAVKLVISLLAYLVYAIDSHQKFWLRVAWGSESAASFYYICGALLFFALLGLSGCFITWYDPSVQDDLAQPCNELCLCCCQSGICVEPVNCYLPGPLCTWNESGCTTCFESECDCSGGAGESGLPLLFTMALIVLILFAVIGIFYSILVATMVGQRIWQRHYHILAKMSLTKEYVVEDVYDETSGSPPPLPPEHVQQLEALGLL